jgi:hypothetical protein
MDKREALAAALHLELERLKSELLITTDEAQRHSVHRRINICIRERIMLIHQLQYTSWAAQTPFLKSLRKHHVSKP